MGVLGVGRGGCARGRSGWVRYRGGSVRPKTGLSCRGFTCSAPPALPDYVRVRDYHKKTGELWGVTRYPGGREYVVWGGGVCHGCGVDVMMSGSVELLWLCCGIVVVVLWSCCGCVVVECG